MLLHQPSLYPEDQIEMNFHWSQVQVNLGTSKYLEAPVQLGFLNHQVQDVPVITALSTANRRQVCGTGQRTD